MKDNSKKQNSQLSLEFDENKANATDTFYNSQAKILCFETCKQRLNTKTQSALIRYVLQNTKSF